MTIASSNVSFSAIAAEKGIGNSNLSLKFLSGTEVKQQNVAGTGAGSIYALAKETWTYGRDNSRTSGTVTSAQGQGSAGLNTAPYSLSEWIGYDPVQTIIGSSGVSVIQHFTLNDDAGCFAPFNSGIQIFAKKSGSTITIYGEIANGQIINYGYPQRRHSDGSLSVLEANTVLGTITENTSGMLPTGCTMSHVIYSNTSSGTFFGSTAVVSTISGGTNSTTNLGSTEVGYKISQNGISEGYGNQSGTGQLSAGIRFNWTWPTAPDGQTYQNSRTEVAVVVSATVQHDSDFDAC